ncbi:hypothetical protein KBD71_03645 [Candidatus Woesebacteria bacterium]|nr:hypothetical protein [Candidatus Woesebacteria bacterium]
MSKMDSLQRFISRVAVSAGLIAGAAEAVQADQRTVDGPPLPRQSDAIRILSQATNGGLRDAETIRTVNIADINTGGVSSATSTVWESYRQLPASERNSSEYMGDLFAEWGVITAEVAGTLDGYHFRPLDPFPESDYQKQFRYLSESTIFPEFSEYVTPELLDQHFYMPGDVLVFPNQYEVYVFSHDENGTAMFINPRNTGNQNAYLSIQEIKLIPVPVDGQVLRVNIPAFRNFQARAREFFETDNSPETVTVPQIPQKVWHYGNYASNGFGFRNGPEDTEITTIEGMVNRVFNRHQMVESILGQEGEMLMHVDLTFVNSDGLIANYDQSGNGIGDTEDFINAIVDRAHQEGKQVEFTIDIRVPENWQVDNIQQFITDFFGPTHAYLSDSVRNRMGAIGLSIDPELPGTQGLGGTPLTYADINNLFVTARLSGMTGRFWVYDVGVTPSDGYLNTQNSESDSPVESSLHPEVGFVSMGIGSVEDKRNVIESRATQDSLGTERAYGQMMFYPPISPYLGGPGEYDQFSDPESFLHVLQPSIVDGIPVSLEYVALQ